MYKILEDKALCRKTVLLPPLSRCLAALILTYILMFVSANTVGSNFIAIHIYT